MPPDTDQGRFSGGHQFKRCSLGARMLAGVLCALPAGAAAQQQVGEYVLESGHPSLQSWLLPENPRMPATVGSDAVIDLGRRLFFERGLSGDGSMSCASCHIPALGWSDGLPVAKGRDGKPLRRATPTILNVGFNDLLMWDGRFTTLEEQVAAPVTNPDEMGADMATVLDFISNQEAYRKAFANAFPGEHEPIKQSNVEFAIAAFERTLVSRDSPFDRWVRGDASAMTPKQVEGFAVFLDPDRGNCVACHGPPNFTDDGFHNIGLASFGAPEPDPGRYAERPIRSMQGAFKTPTLRSVVLTAPYFHDGSAASLEAVVEHYADGGSVTDNLSPNLAELDLSLEEQRDLVTFLHALTGAGQASIEGGDDKLSGESPDNPSTAASVARDTPDQNRSEDIE